VCEFIFISLYDDSIVINH